MESREKLQNMIDQVESWKREATKLEGQLEQIESQMEEMGYKSIDELDKAIKELKQKKQYLQQQFDDGVKDLEEKYQWD